MGKTKNNFPPKHSYRLPIMRLNSKPLRLMRVLFTQNVDLNGAASLLGISISTANQQVRAMRDYYQDQLSLEELPSVYEVFKRLIMEGYLDLNNPEHNPPLRQIRHKQTPQSLEPVTTRASPPAQMIRHRAYGA